MLSWTFLVRLVGLSVDNLLFLLVNRSPQRQTQSSIAGSHGGSNSELKLALQSNRIEIVKLFLFGHLVAVENCAAA